MPEIVLNKAILRISENAQGTDINGVLFKKTRVTKVLTEIELHRGCFLKFFSILRKIENYFQEWQHLKLKTYVIWIYWRMEIEDT